MTHEELIKRYNSYGMEERDKQLFMEYLTILNYMPDEDFSNILNIENISDAEFLSIFDFYYQQDCYLMLFKLLRDYKEKRLVRPDAEEIKCMELRKDLEERMLTYAPPNPPSCSKAPGPAAAGSVPASG